MNSSASQIYGSFEGGPVGGMTGKKPAGMMPPQAGGEVPGAGMASGGGGQGRMPGPPSQGFGGPAARPGMFPGGGNASGPPAQAQPRGFGAPGMPRGPYMQRGMGAPTMGGGEAEGDPALAAALLAQGQRFGR